MRESVHACAPATPPIASVVWGRDAVPLHPAGCAVMRRTNCSRARNPPRHSYRLLRSSGGGCHRHAAACRIHFSAHHSHGRDGRLPLLRSGVGRLHPYHHGCRFRELEHQSFCRSRRECAISAGGLAGGAQRQYGASGSSAARARYRASACRGEAAPARDLSELLRQLRPQRRAVDGSPEIPARFANHHRSGSHPRQRSQRRNRTVAQQ